jgi:ribA/ribD-fused uncharacterized protein
MSIPPDLRILYYSRDRETFGFFSHFHAALIVVEGEKWPTVEHYYQAQKSLDRLYHHAIRNAPTPGAAKRLTAPPAGPRRVSKRSWFRKHGVSPRSDWHEVKLEIMRRGDWAKFTQHSDLTERLLATGEAELIEDSPSEPFWGTDSGGSGLNWAGRVLMEIRIAFRAGSEFFPTS